MEQNQWGLSTAQQTAIQQAVQWLREADAILITASNGLSISEGYHIFADNDAFKTYFGEFRERYGINCLIRGVFTPMSPEDHRRYLARVHQYLIGDYMPGGAVMQNLFALVGKKEYFILTSNGDTHLQMNGFSDERIFEIEGNFDGLDMHNPEWFSQKECYDGFLAQNENRNLVVLELGIGMRNQLIKKPVMDMVQRNARWKYITMNLPQEILLPTGAKERAIAIAGDIGKNLQTMREELCATNGVDSL